MPTVFAKLVVLGLARIPCEWRTGGLILALAIAPVVAAAQDSDDAAIRPVAQFSFDNDLANKGSGRAQAGTRQANFAKGLRNQCLRILPSSSRRSSVTALPFERLRFSGKQDFSIEFWVRTGIDSSQQIFLLGNKSMPDLSLRSQKKAGWFFGVAHGTWMWNIGSGERRLIYHRDNGKSMPLNDGRWHQLAMTYDHQDALVRLYYDGANWVTYNLADDRGFDFASKEPFVIGADLSEQAPTTVPQLITQGQKELQAFVDQYNQLSNSPLKDNELTKAVVGPARLVQSKNPELSKEDSDVKAAIELLEKLNRKLMRNPFTIHQAPSFMEVAPLSRIYSLKSGKIAINAVEAEKYIHQSLLGNEDFSIDELKIWDQVVPPQKIADSYARFFQPRERLLAPRVNRLTAGAFNIFHGGKHFSVDQHGWDSRKAIAQLLKREKVDLIMMQETYSSGDFIAAELGYYFATTVDWDYLNQGSNISIMSRYPIEKVVVPPRSAFMNVAAQIRLSQAQQVIVMSNWYGMQNFDDVFQFHRARVDQANRTPVIFGGDFNAIPDGDGGKSLASQKLLGAGFVDAFREQFPDHKTKPGHTHRSGRRIDQLYYKGKGLENTQTNVISTWPSGFPSDHYLIKSVFKWK